MIRIFVLSLLIASALVGWGQQMPLGPIKVEPSGGKEKPIVISAAGIEHDPLPIVGHWSSADICLTDISCFLSNWIEANSSGNLQHLVALRPLDEKNEFEHRISQNPNIVSLNADRFKNIKQWSLIGWVEYGPFEIVLLVKQDEKLVMSAYALPLIRTGENWAQTDALSNDPGVNAILDRIANAVMQRHRPKPKSAK
jgi:hypothetical protein